MERMTIADVVALCKATEGYRVYQIDKREYAFIVTPKANVLCVQRATWGEGFIFTFNYKPSRKCGTGCSCHDKDTWDWGLKAVTIKGIEELEEEGYRYAKRLRAELYESSEEFLEYERKFFGDKLREVI